MNVEFLNKLNPAQKRAAMTTEGPLLIIAGAGSGKTTVLINRLAYMIERGIDPQTILLLTFTNAAADNMKQRAKDMVGERCNQITACTYHSFCALEVRKFAGWLGLPNDFSIISPGEVTDAIRLLKAELGYSAIKGFPHNAVIAEMLSKSINTNTPYETFIEEEAPAFKEELLQIRTSYEEYKLNKGLCDYDDLLVHMNTLLQFEEIRQNIAYHYNYIMVDEYQDTNSLQESIVMNLARSSRNLCVVGDGLQSIYGWRGSDIRNIIEFPERIGDCPIVPIMTNYRSTKEILDVANCVVTHHAPEELRNEMIPYEKTGERPKVILLNNQDIEAAFIYNQIIKENKLGVPMDEISILSRSSMATTRLELLLQKNGIPFRKMGGLKFLDHTCIQDMLAMLRITANPLDELGWYRTLCLLPGVGDIYARKISNIVSSSTHPDVSSFEKRKFYHDLTEYINHIHYARQLSWEECFSYLLDIYIEMREKFLQVAQVSEETREEMQTELNQDQIALAQLQELAAPYKKITEFLDSIVLESTAPAEEAQLTISTVHSAKGLEWNTVFLMDCIDGVFPKEVMDIAEFEEELRCFYVAMTRAKNNLYFMVPATFMKNGKFISGEPTFLLNEVLEQGLVLVKEIKAPEPKKVYLDVPYHEKEEAKAYGAKWDGERRQWFFYSNGTNDHVFAKWNFSNSYDSEPSHYSFGR